MEVPRPLRQSFDAAEGVIRVTLSEDPQARDAFIILWKQRELQDRTDKPKVDEGGLAQEVMTKYWSPDGGFRALPGIPADVYTTYLALDLLQEIGSLGLLSEEQVSKTRALVAEAKSELGVAYVPIAVFRAAGRPVEGDWKSTYAAFKIHDILAGRKP